MIRRLLASTLRIVFMIPRLAVPWVVDIHPHGLRPMAVQTISFRQTRRLRRHIEESCVQVETKEQESIAQGHSVSRTVDVEEEPP